MPLTKKNLRSKIKGELRRIWFRSWKPRQEALKRNTLSKGLYLCDKCQKVKGKHEVQVHHKVPVSEDKTLDWNKIIERLFEENLAAYEVLCLTCHKSKHR